MNLDKLKCPSCGKLIELSKALSAELEASAKQTADELLEAERSKLVAENNRLIEAEKLKTSGLVEAAKKEAKAYNEARLKDLADQLLEQKIALEKSQGAELELRRAQRKLEEDKRTFELEMSRKLDEERASIVDKVRSEEAERTNLTLAEKDKKVSDALAQVDDLKRKLEQKSSQLQGEIFELELESSLRTAFPHDTITPVAKGVKGGDILQDVGAGIIMWELKRTKSFSAGWLPKCREDARNCKAGIAVIVTETLPKEVDSFGMVDGVWVVSIPLAVALAGALRLALLAEAKALTVKAGKATKAEEIYDYVTGMEFQGRVTAIVEAFVTMRTELEAEKRAISNAWAKREKTLERVALQLAGMHGDLSGIVGSALPGVKALQLEEGI